MSLDEAFKVFDGEESPAADFGDHWPSALVDQIAQCAPRHRQRRCCCRIVKQQLERGYLGMSDMGIELNDRQMKRAAEKDATSKRKLPFFVDPIDGKLKIEKGALVRIYREAQIDAESSTKY